MTLRGRDYLSVDDLTPEELRGLLGFARDLKARAAAGDRPPLLAGKALAMVFEKPSLRTRVSFEVGMFQLGGTAFYLSPQDIQLGVRESIPDVARNLDRMVDGIMARTFAHATVTSLAEGSHRPVINGLSDLEHPCQALGDLLTVAEWFPRFEDVRLAWVGDSNNVCTSLLLGAAKLGVQVAVATPPGYAPAEAILSRSRTIAAATERKWNKVAAYRRAGGAAEVWLVVHTTATVEGRDGLTKLEREEVGACNFDRLYLFDVFNLRALQRWPVP